MEECGNRKRGGGGDGSSGGVYTPSQAVYLSNFNAHCRSHSSFTHLVRLCFRFFRFNLLVCVGKKKRKKEKQEEEEEREKMKRKGVDDQASHDFSDFHLSSPATKIRRLVTLRTSFSFLLHFFIWFSLIFINFLGCWIASNCGRGWSRSSSASLWGGWTYPWNWGIALSCFR